MRRHWMPLLIALALALVMVAVTVSVASWRDTTRPILRTTTVKMDVEREYRLLHVTDLHGVRFGDGQDRIAALIDEREFDAVLLTGDMVRRTGADRTGTLELAELAKKHAPLVVYVRGNHDDAGVGPALAELGVIDLTEQDAARLRGVTIQRMPAPGAAVRAPSSTDLVVIPEHIPPNPQDLARLTDAASPPTIVLSGHMHGGQWRLPLLGAGIAPPSGQNDSFTVLPELQGIRTRGLFRDGATVSHISPGLGSVSAMGLPYWLFERRLGSRAQVDEIVIVPAGREQQP